MNSEGCMKVMRYSAGNCKVPFSPTIFEHSAAFIGRTPSEVAVNGLLLEEAHIKAYEKYRHNIITVGIDVYNIEAEALGCKIKYHDDYSIPGAVSHPWANYDYTDNIDFSIEKGRIKMVLNAAEHIKLKLGSMTNVAVGICGPFSIAAELVGYENIIMDCVAEGEKTKSLLNEILDFQKKYSDEIISRDLGTVIFESWASPPLISPGIYREYALPFEKELISHLKSRGAVFVPLVIGGDTTPIVDDIISTGTSVLLADYMVDIGLFIEKASKVGLAVRGNIDPKLIEGAAEEEIIHCVKKILDKANGYSKFILGTGVVPYNTPPNNILAIIDYLNNQYLNNSTPVFLNP